MSASPRSRLLRGALFRLGRRQCGGGAPGERSLSAWNGSLPTDEMLYASGEMYSTRPETSMARLPAPFACRTAWPYVNSHSQLGFARSSIETGRDYEACTQNPYTPRDMRHGDQRPLVQTVP